jgi:MFS family permease
MNLLLLNFFCMQACTAGIRMAATLWVLQHGGGAWEVGLMLSFHSIVPIFAAMSLAKLFEKYGYRTALVASTLLVAIGILAATCATEVARLDFALLCGAIAFGGAANNLSLIAAQRETGRRANNADERLKLFSLLSLAPSLGLVAGPLYAGLLIEYLDFSYVFLLLAVWIVGCIWMPPTSRPRDIASKIQEKTESTWVLLKRSSFQRLLLVNLILNGCWDLYNLAIPVLGHGLGYSALETGCVLGSFAAGVMAVRLVMSLRPRESNGGALMCNLLLATTAIFFTLPLVASIWLVGICSFFLGGVLGATQPMIMTALFEMMPFEQQSRALALRSMSLNVAAAVTPAIFALSAGVGISAIFWSAAGAAVLGRRLIRIDDWCVKADRC